MPCISSPSRQSFPSSVVQRLTMNAVDLTTQLHDIKVCFLTTLIIMCISARIGIAMIDSCGMSASQSFCFSRWLTYLGKCFREWWPHEFVCRFLQPLARALKISIQVCFHPLPTCMMWLFIAGVSFGWDSVDVTSIFRSLFPVLYPPCRFCMLGVWIYWFVGLTWAFCYRQWHRCGLIHTAHFGRARPRIAKLIRKNRYFVGHRCRRSTIGGSHFCNMRYPVKPHLFHCQDQDRCDQTCSDSKRSFLNRHLYLVNKFFGFLATCTLLLRFFTGRSLVLHQERCEVANQPFSAPCVPLSLSNPFFCNQLDDLYIRSSFGVVSK